MLKFDVSYLSYFSHKRDKSRAETHRQDVKERGASESHLLESLGEGG